MNLTIDNRSCDVAPGLRIESAYDADWLRSSDSARTGRTLTLDLPHTVANDLLFGCHSLFNAGRHTARLTHDGALLHAGTVRLLAVSNTGYRIDIRSGGAAWAKSAALGRFGDIPLAFEGLLTPTDIRAGWTDDRPVKFLPVVRDSYEQRNDSADLRPVLRLLSPDDYHPFLRIDALVRAVFAGAGYRIESRFMETELFRSLYMSGAYAARDTVAAEKRMGFRAVRLTTATATADAAGRVYATPYGAGNIVGNLVETATPFATDETGTARTDAYNNGNCFGFDDRRIVYRPSAVLSIGFEYRLRYTTQHRIATRERLAGFDQVYLGTGSPFAFRLPNRYEDRRDDLRAGTTYRAVVFGGTANGQFRLRYTRNGSAGTLWTDFTGRSAPVTTPATGTCSAPVLYAGMGDGTWVVWPGDWALYDGYIGETGETTVELTLRTSAERVGPAAPKYFNTLYFGGAEEGMRFTLHPTCSVRPLFSPAPAFGARLVAADVMQHQVRQQVLLEAVQHLFDLRFYTDEETKTVYIEPDADFWDEAREADWRGRTDLAERVVWHDAALEAHESRTYGYRTGDGATARLGEAEGAPFGSWQVFTGSAATLEGDEACTNPLFCPTLNAAGMLTEAPSARLMQVGDRDDTAGDGFNFAPRIVRYCGLRRLPAGERWNDAAGDTDYPFAAFHWAGDEQTPPFTLCFGDRDGLPGLHRFRERAERILTRQHVTLTLRIEAHEYENLFRPGTGAPDLRWVFRLTTDRGDVRATLRRIECYDPATAAARCMFTLLPHDRL